MKIGVIFVFFLLFTLSGCNISSPAPSVPTVVEKRITTEVVGKLVTNIPPSISSSPSPVSTIAPTDEMLTDVIGEILPLPDQDFANLRNGPGAIYDQIATLKAKQSVFVIGKNADGTWWKVTVHGLTGWVYTDYVFIAGDTSGVPCISVTSECESPISQENYEKAVSVIRTFLQEPGMQLSFQSISSNPNVDMRQVMIFADSLGSHYSVDVQTFQVVEYLPERTVEPSGLAKKELTELRNLASAFAARTSPALQQTIDRLRYTEEIGEQTFAFRWEDDDTQGKSSRTFLQIVLNANGEILHYINTFDVVEN